MIEVDAGLFHVYTENTSYVFSVQDNGYPEHIYYGRRLRDPKASFSAIREKHLKAPTMATIADRTYSQLSLDDTLLEFSTEGKGDYRIPLIALSYGPRGDRTLNLKYKAHKVYNGIRRFKGVKLPQAVATDNECDTLEVTFEDTVRRIRCVFFYTAFHRADTITRRTVIFNDSKESITLRSALSAQFDIRETGFTATTLQGTWGREKMEKTTLLTEGTFSTESRTISSSEADPSLILSKGNEAYLFNLVYSGTHRTTATVTPHGMTHVVWGINPDMFSWVLGENESFETPEAVLAYSSKGLEGISQISRKFIERHIRRGPWRDRMKPIMLNTWDTLYYDPDESEVFEMAKEAKNLGIEGICVDDGWFGARADETTSLGDWYADTRHFPSGMKDLSNEIHYLGLMFGLWFEMEGISQRSMLYKEHPDWIIGKNGETNSVGKNQQLLDLTRTDVQDWIIAAISKVIDYTSLDYIRWSFSRNHSDLWSNLGEEDMGAFAHRYMLGLYRILDTLTKTYPNLYIESTARGGLRMDLGMLSYSASIRTTECSDSLLKLRVQEGASRIYPLSVMSTAITGNPDRHTARTIDYETKFNTACFGVLQYGINPKELNRLQKFALKQQIEFYKAYRPLFQYGVFRVVEDNDEKALWTVDSGDHSTIIVLYYRKRTEINTTAERLKVWCAEEGYDYSFIARDQYQDDIQRAVYPQEMECYTLSGDALKWAGIALK
ncbi:MAG: alpha-galactosidase, partial [Spirochaetales bacterium]|nr:alpha-galactosidase [Candidatus Physcosoma equi]